MVEKVLVIVPHGDDEINLVGTIMDQFTSLSIQVHVLFITNGDYDPQLATERMQETMRVVREMGFAKTIFLGYCDDLGCDGRHLYYTEEDCSYLSKSKHSETYGIGTMVDYRFSISGKHSAYNRMNLKQDLKACILSEQADLLICVDFDSHPDHRMTSILFEEIVGELVKEKNYCPIVLKKFAYAGAWFGTDEYFCCPMKQTELHEFQLFPYSADQMLRLQVLPRNYSSFFWKTNVYKWTRQYKTQQAKDHFWNIVHADSVAFFRDTSNLLLNAEVSASSGEAKYLSDFKLCDTPGLRNEIEIISQQDEFYTWKPDLDDENGEISIVFMHPVTIKQLKFYQPFEKRNRVQKIFVQIDNRNTMEYALNGLLVDEIVFERALHEVSKLRICVPSNQNSARGFRELEIFDHISRFPWERTPFSPFCVSHTKRSKVFSKLIEGIVKSFRYYWKQIHIIMYLINNYGLNYIVKRIFVRIKHFLGVFSGKSKNKTNL